MSMSPMLAFGLATGAQAFMQYRAGQAQQAMYDAQARQAEIEARSRAIQAKQAAADKLTQMNSVLASITANAAANGVDALSGSALSLQNYAIREGSIEYHLAQDNAGIAESMGQYQASIYRSAGKQAYQQGLLSAATTLASGYYGAKAGQQQSSMTYGPSGSIHGSSGSGSYFTSRGLTEAGPFTNV